MTEASETRASLAHHLRRLSGDACDQIDADRLTRAAALVETFDTAVLAARGAEREKWLEALTPSAETKAAYMGEFTFPASYLDEYGDEQTWGLNVPWITIKEIMKVIRARASQVGET